MAGELTEVVTAVQFSGREGNSEIEGVSKGGKRERE